MKLMLAIFTAMTLAAPHLGAAQSIDDLNRIAEEAAAKGLPAAPLTNKIREGLAKGAPATAHRDGRSADGGAHGNRR